jgi:hypothetical protein
MASVHTGVSVAHEQHPPSPAPMSSALLHRMAVFGSPALGSPAIIAAIGDTEGTRAVTAIIAAIGDTEGTRAVTAIIALLVVLGIVLVMVAVWLVRSTRPDPEVLAPLEVMGDRSWRRADPVWQRRKLDAVRPDGAEPLLPSVAPPDLDEAFDLGPAASGFDDLHDDVPAADGSDEQTVSSDGDRLDDGPADASDATDATGDDVTDDDREDAPNVEHLDEPVPVDAGDVDVDSDSEFDSDTGAVAAFDPDIELETPSDIDADDGDMGTDVGAGDDVLARILPAPVALPPPPLRSLIDPVLRARIDEAASTPTGIARPIPEDLPEHELDPELLAAAMVDLDNELMSLRRRNRDLDDD